MPSETFLAELNDLSVTDWQKFCLLKFGTERIEGGAREALKIVTDAFMSVIRAETGENAPRLLHINDFLASVGPPPPALAGDILPAKKLIILGGAPKEGKSLVALEILHSIAAGVCAMDRFDVGEPGAVAYFGMEDGAQEIKERLEMRGARDIPLYVCSQSFNMHTPEGKAYFELMIQGMPEPPVLVVVDTVRKAFPTVKDWNDAAQVGPVIAPLCDWAHENCTVILVHHTNKNPMAVGVNKLSGSNALTSSADGFMILEDKQRQEGTGNLRWKFEADGRGGMGGKYTLEMDTNTLHVRVLQDADEEQERKEKQEKRNEEVRSQILSYAQSTGAFTIGDVAPLVNCPNDIAGRRVREMEASGLLVKTGETRKTGRGQPAHVYAPAPKIGDSKGERLNSFSELGGVRPEKSNPSEALTTFFDLESEAL